jgi:hypothetical protein
MTGLSLVGLDGVLHHISKDHVADLRRELVQEVKSGRCVFAHGGSLEAEEKKMTCQKLDQDVALYFFPSVVSQHRVPNTESTGRKSANIIKQDAS